ncbi:MAG: YfhO family protein [Firmicutes bacterium]|nr:YfhO family protein [Bacillota bacterium]
MKHNKYALAAFFLPVLITVLAFAVTGIYPFGGNQITVIDMYHQYVPFLSELQYKLHHGGSLFYSWDGAGGFNFWNLISYYGASPLNLLLFFFPEKLIVEGVTVILLLKIGFAGCFMYLFLTTSCGRDALIWLRSASAGAWIRVAMGSLYALSAYTCAYYWCIMWIDVMALLPLIILGLTRLVEQGRGILYAVSLGLASLCNYYITLMVCIFVVLYYLCLYFSRKREGGIAGFLLTTVKTAACSVIGAGLAAPMLIPTYISMKNTYYTPSELPEEWTFYSSPLEVVNQLLPLAHLSYREGLPNICAGLLVTMMLVCFFVSRTIPLRSKVCHGLLLAVLFFSLNVNGLDFMWHGFHYPNELPFRWSFCVCFVLTSMGCRALTCLPQIRVNTLWGILAGGLGYYLIAERLLRDSAALDVPEEFFYIGIGLLGLYTAILMVYRKGWLSLRGTVLLLVVAVSAELFCSVSLSFDKVGNVERASYLEGQKEIGQLTRTVSDDFARTELYEWSLMNTPALYHYRGLSQFSSSLNSHATELMEKIGLEGEPGKNRYNYVFSDPVTNAMLNLKYIIGGDKPLNDPDFTEKADAGDYTLYENRQPLSIGYMLPESIRTWDLISSNPYQVLNDYVRAATGNQVESVFRELEADEAEGFDATVSEEGSGIFNAWSEDSREGMVQLKYTADEEGSYFVYVETSQAEMIDVIYDDGESLSLREDCGAVVNIGPMQKGETFMIEINYETDGGGDIRSHVCTIDRQAWDRAYGMISRDLLEVTDFSDTSIDGTIRASEDGILTTSVLNEQGWRLQVDGEKQEITETVGGDFIAVPLKAGEHRIRLSFRPPGFAAGCVILLICAGLLVCAAQLRHRRIRRRRQPEISSSGM